MERFPFPEARPVRLRILLPPTLAGCVQRNAIPAKLELEDDRGERIAPEKADPASFGELSDSERSALFALSQWCGGTISSFIQLDLAQAGELLKLLHGVPCFYPANDPNRAIEWAGDELIGVSDFIPFSQPEPPRPVREVDEGPDPEPEPVFSEPEYEGPPIEVEGSTEYLRIILPSSEHPGYKEVLRLMREWNFLRDRSHRHWWWLRDPSRVLDFLAAHQEELELDHEAEFTENFRRLTSGIMRAELRTSATEDDEGAEVEVCIEAGEVTPASSNQWPLSTEGKGFFQRVFQRIFPIRIESRYGMPRAEKFLRTLRRWADSSSPRSSAQMAKGLSTDVVQKT